MAANAFVEGDCLEDLEALREDVVIQRAIGRKDLPDPTPVGDFCRWFTLGHLLQLNQAFVEIQQKGYKHRPAGFLRRLKRKVRRGIKEVHLRSGSALYSQKVIEFCGEEG